MSERSNIPPTYTDSVVSIYGLPMGRIVIDENNMIHLGCYQGSLQHFASTPVDRIKQEFGFNEGEWWNLYGKSLLSLFEVVIESRDKIAKIKDEIDWAELEKQRAELWKDVPTADNFAFKGKEQGLEDKLSSDPMALGWKKFGTLQNPNS